MAFLTREQILAVDDRPISEIDLPEWGGKARYRKWTLGQSIEWGRMVAKNIEEGGSAHELYVYVLINSLVDEKGEQMFTKEDAEALVHKSKDPAERLFKAVLEDARVDSDAVEDSKKN